MRKIINILLVLVVTAELGFFLYFQTNTIVIHSQTINDSELAAFFNGFKVVQISDLHIYRFGNRERMLVSLIGKLDPQLIFITGDFANRNSTIVSALKVVGKIAENRNVIAILGNSDHQNGLEKIDTQKLVSGLNKIGVHILVNKSIKLKNEVDSVYIIGLDDNYLWKDDFFKATANVPSTVKKILLAHSPDIVSKVRLGKINLVLSGHTHGGQINLPFVGAIVTNRVCNSFYKFVSGLYSYQNTKLYVNRGIGTSSVPLRLFCRPEITVFEFHKK